jgi:hypothetical protein
MSEPKSYPNARDCEHGRRRGKCVECDFDAIDKRLEATEKRVEVLLADVTEAYHRLRFDNDTDLRGGCVCGLCPECVLRRALARAEDLDAHKRVLAEVVADRDSALARFNAGGISHGGKLDMGVTIALEHFERLNAEVKALKAEAEATTARLRADELVTISMGKHLDRLKKQLHEEDMTRCDLEADLQTFGGVSVEDGLRAGIFDLIALRDALVATRAADLIHFGEKVAALCETRAGYALITAKELTNMLETK